MEKIVFTLPENLPQVLIVHRPPLQTHKSRRNDQQLGYTCYTLFLLMLNVYVKCISNYQEFLDQLEITDAFNFQIRQ